MDQQTSSVSDCPPLSRQAGTQPIPGYRLLEPLGRGGFGEVWKCEAPGGLYKAVKFVRGNDEQGGAAVQEMEALQRVKAIRHPFILSLDRVEVLDNDLVIVMELADKSLHALLADYQTQERPGIPREELLGYLLEAAEALDWMNFGHGLQHLDIKPHNLFLVSNHVKVADFGLVDSLSSDPDAETAGRGARNCGLTPLYAAPEMLRGTISRHSDQYSLAIVYQQLLTGTVPFWCPNMYQLMLLHLTGEPNLAPLPAEDRPVVARALSKCPDRRFPSCLDFLQALVCGDSAGGAVKVDLPQRAAAVKRLLKTAPRAEERPTKSLRRPDEGQPDTQSARARAAAARTPSGAAQTMPPGSVPMPGSAPGVPPAPPASVPLPGYRFLSCLGQSPLGDVWRVEDERGRHRRALCLSGAVETAAALGDRLGGLEDPALPPVVALRNPQGRLVLITDEFEQTLRGRFEECLKQGMPGIPRGELLAHLGAAARALDALYQEYGLAHLGLNPRTLVLQKGAVWLAEFGVVPLFWMAAGQSAGSLNGRYAAPELFDNPASGRPESAGLPAGRGGPASDQFSLALVYAEMLSGVVPRAPRPAPEPGGRRPHAPPPRPTARLDLDLVPSSDRDILTRALADDPRHRFPTCAALIDALEAATPGPARGECLYQRLPAVIPFASLLGEPPPRHAVLPSVADFVTSLASLPGGSRGRTILGPQNVRYVVQASDVWECRCPVQVFTGAMRLKVEGFRAEWNAQIASENDNSFVMQIDLPQEGTDRRNGSGPPRVTVELEVQPTTASDRRLAEARMRIRPAGNDRGWIGRLLPQLAPRLFDSLRGYLQASPEQRSEDRWNCPQPLHVYPVLPSVELDEVLEGISRNVSPGGVSFRLSAVPRAEQAYLHWHRSSAVSRFAILARIMRVQPMAGGGYEVGAAFPSSVMERG